jgi:hypothetical protein
MPLSIEDQIIEVYSVAMQEYFKYISISDAVSQSKYSKQIVYVGWLTLSNIFNVAYIQTRNLEKTYRSFQKAYLVYLEYVEQIICAIPSHKFDKNGVVIFVYNKIFNELDKYKTGVPENHVVIRDELLTQLAQFSSVVYDWSNQSLSTSDRYDIGEKYLHSYLLMFCKPENKSWINLFSAIMEKNNSRDCETHSMALTEFYNYAKTRKLPDDDEKIKEACREYIHNDSSVSIRQLFEYITN